LVIDQKMLIEKLFLKKRIVLYADNALKKQALPDHYSFLIYDDVTRNDISNNDYLKVLINKRLKKKNWVFFAVIDNRTRLLVAQYWAIFCRKNNYWHDNFVVLPDTALLCNAYVDKEHRFQGIYKFLIFAAHDYLLKNNFKKIFTLVEASNISSLKANKSEGLSVDSINYLIKLFGFNLISIFMKSSKITMALFGSKFLKTIIYRNKYF